MKPGTKKALRWLWVIPALLLVAAGAFVVWGLTPLGPSPQALAALESGDGVTVSEGAGGWVFMPRGEEPTRGLVYYPGGHVDARSYAPPARELAKRGYLVVVPEMPLSLAFFNLDAADKVIEEYPGVRTWVMAGHSLGGVAAATYAAKHPDSVGGLVLYASYPAGGTDLSGAKLAVASRAGTLDGVVDRANLESSYALLPPDTDTAPIEGGNHAQFGSYGPQPGDNPAAISAEGQWRIAADTAEAVFKRATQR